MYYSGNEPVYFPSATVEMVIWAILVVLLLVVERKQKRQGTMWPLLMIWFGVIRFSVDFLRESEWERRPYFLSLSGGQFWSLVAAVIGVVFLILVFRMHKKAGTSEEMPLAL